MYLLLALITAGVTITAIWRDSLFDFTILWSILLSGLCMGLVWIVWAFEDLDYHGLHPQKKENMKSWAATYALLSLLPLALLALVGGVLWGVYVGGPLWLLLNAIALRYFSIHSHSPWPFCTIGIHRWYGYSQKCLCELCDVTRHIWDGCTCVRCGSTRNEGHTFTGCSCSRCGLVTAQAKEDKCHDWHNGMCSRCGQFRLNHEGVQAVVAAASAELYCTRPPLTKHQADEVLKGYRQVSRQYSDFRHLFSADHVAQIQSSDYELWMRPHEMPEDMK